MKVYNPNFCCCYNSFGDGWNLVLELEQGICFSVSVFASGWPHTSAVFHGLQPSFDVDSFGFLLAMPKKPVLVTIEEFEELKKQLEVQKKMEICGNNDE